MKYLKLVTAFFLLISISVLSVDFFQKARRLQVTKAQYSEINNFSYGLFSIDEWKTQLTQIVSDEIGSLSFKGETGRTLRSHLEKQLGILIDKIAMRMKNQNNKTTEGWLKQSFIESFVDVKEIKKGIPEYAGAMMKELTSPRTEKEIKGLLKTKVDEYMNESFDTQDDALRVALVAKFGAGNEDKAKAVLEKKLNRGHSRGQEEAWLVIGLSVALFLLLGLSKKPLTPPEYWILSATLFILMFVGVTTPMIDMEAKISELSFVLMDHPVTFKDQVLFYQSKSILDVFHIMITHNELKMKAVGVLLVTFSVIFPLFKLLSTMAYYYDYCAARSKKLVQFFVLHSGKWSMADVLVVAIFMAYIGFNGIINSQMKNIQEAGGQSMGILTTNGTQLQPGYFIFLTFTILALFLSNFLKNRPYDCRPGPSKT
jgi:hypothetical protein